MEVQPSVILRASRIVVIGDVHGDMQTWMRCLYAAKLFNGNLEWIAEPRDTIVVQLGDQVDSLSRGGDSNWEILPDIDMIYLTDRLDQNAKRHGGRVLSLLGNHEMMNILGDFTYVSEASKARIALPLRAAMFKPGAHLSKILAKRNIILKIGKHIFCHGGIMPSHLDAVHDDWPRINEVARQFINGNPLTTEETQILMTTVVSNESCVWTRFIVDLFNSTPELLQEIVSNVLNRMNARMIYLGHNTVQNIVNLPNQKVFLLDAALSRAYPKTSESSTQVLDIMHPDTPEEVYKILHIQAKN